MTNDGFGLGRIGQISVPVRDLEAAIRFYRDALGIPFLFRADTMAFLSCGDVRLMLAVPEGEDGSGASILYFRVDEIDEAHRTLSDRGVEFVREPHRTAELEEHELWMAFFRDVDGNLMALMSEVPK